jgi:hypothetical protein
VDAVVEHKVPQRPFLVENQRLAVRRPVGIFEKDGCGVTDAPIGGGNDDRLEGAVQHRLTNDGGQRFDFDVRENRRFCHFFIVRTDTKAYVEVTVNENMHRRTGRRHVAFGIRNGYIDVVAALFYAHAMRTVAIGFYLVGVRASGIAVLQGGEAVAVTGDIGVDRVRIERLTNHQHGFAVRIALVADEIDIGTQGQVAGHFSPNVVEVIDAEPEVGATAGDGVPILGRVVMAAPRMENSADVP